MEDKYSKYEAVIGLEVHAQLLTASKAYSEDLNQYGGKPNSQISVLSLGHPGTLPVANKKHLELAIKMGLALGSTIHKETIFSRKNYFYADLPKGYQITQDKTPLCTGGKVQIKNKNGETRDIGITRIHIEEDSGKSQHDIDPFNTLVDLNRAGIPLIEIVTEPDFKQAQEAYDYLVEIRKIVRYLEICDGNMEEGSLRCDANVSVMLHGASKFGTKVEVKNMNSISNVKRAIDYEIKRQIDDLENGLSIAPDTRGFDAGTGTTHAQRSKEEANDYRYFPEPDLPPVVLEQYEIDKIKAQMPPMHWELHEKFVSQYGLSDYDATILAGEKYFALYFEDLAKHTKQYKAAANWMIGPIRAFLNEKALDIREFRLSTEQVLGLIKLVEEGKISFAIARQKLFPALLESEGIDPEELAQKLNIVQDSSDDFLLDIIRQVLSEFPDKVEAYKGGKKNLLGMFMGQIMKKSKGKADPKKTNQILIKELDK